MASSSPTTWEGTPIRTILPYLDQQDLANAWDLERHLPRVGDTRDASELKPATPRSATPPCRSCDAPTISTLRTATVT